MRWSRLLLRISHGFGRANEAILRRLLEIGHSEEFEQIARIPELQSHSLALRLADAHRDDVVSFARTLRPDDRVAFVKAIAMLEHGVGGFGSVTNLERLLPLIEDRERRVLDWVFRNTKSYSYYSHNAHSVEELDLVRRQIAVRKAERVRKDQARQTEDKARIAAEATKKLYGAVRRGDIKAVRALIAQGADPKSPGPDGSPLTIVAMSKGFDDIAAELRLTNNDKAAP